MTKVYRFWWLRLPKESIYIDSCVWIALYKPGELTPEQTAGIAAINDQINRGIVVAVASSLLLVEVLSMSIELIETAFDGRKGLLVAADDSIARSARSLQLKCVQATGKALSNFDAVQLVTASIMGCKRFVTLDIKRKGGQLAPLADKVFLGKLLDLSIVGPEELDDQKRFDFPV